MPLTFGGVEVAEVPQPTVLSEDERDRAQVALEKCLDALGCVQAGDQGSLIGREAPLELRAHQDPTPSKRSRPIAAPGCGAIRAIRTISVNGWSGPVSQSSRSDRMAAVRLGGLA